MQCTCCQLKLFAAFTRAVEHVQMYASECGQDVLSGEGLTMLMEGLCGAAGAQCLPGTQTPAQVVHHLLEALYHCGSAGKATAPAVVISNLHLVVGHLKGHSDSNVRSWAERVSTMFD